MSYTPQELREELIKDYMGEQINISVPSSFDSIPSIEITPINPSPEPITPSPEPITPSPEPITPSPEPITPSPESASPFPTTITPAIITSIFEPKTTDKNYLASKMKTPPTLNPQIELEHEFDDEIESEAEEPVYKYIENDTLSRQFDIKYSSYKISIVPYKINDNLPKPFLEFMFFHTDDETYSFPETVLDKQEFNSILSSEGSILPDIFGFDQTPANEEEVDEINTEFDNQCSQFYLKLFYENPINNNMGFIEDENSKTLFVFYNMTDVLVFENVETNTVPEPIKPVLENETNSLYSTNKIMQNGGEGFQNLQPNPQIREPNQQNQENPQPIQEPVPTNQENPQPIQEPVPTNQENPQPIQEPVPTNQENPQPIQELVPTNQEPDQQIREPVPTNPEPNQQNREPVPTNQEPDQQNREPVPTNPEPNQQNREPVPTNQEPDQQNREPVPTNQEPDQQIREPAFLPESKSLQTDNSIAQVPDYRWIIVDDILNNKWTFKEPTSQLFQNNKIITQIKTQNGEPVPAPISSYLCEEQSAESAPTIFGLSLPTSAYKNAYYDENEDPNRVKSILHEKIVHPILEEIFLFTQLPLSNSNLHKIKRFAIYLENMYDFKNESLLNETDLEHLGDNFWEKYDVLKFKENGQEFFATQDSDLFIEI